MIPRRRLRPLTVLLCAASAMTLTACSNSDAAVQRSEGVTAMVASEAPDLVMQASIAGTLTTTEEGCLAVQNDGTALPLVFPAGSRLSGDGRTIDVPGRGALTTGDVVEGGGGYLTLEDTPDECTPDGDPVESVIWQSLPD